MGREGEREGEREEHLTVAYPVPETWCELCNIFNYIPRTTEVTMLLVHPFVTLDF